MPQVDALELDPFGGRDLLKCWNFKSKFQLRLDVILKHQGTGSAMLFRSVLLCAKKGAQGACRRPINVKVTPNFHAHIQPPPLSPRLLGMEQEDNTVPPPPGTPPKVTEDEETTTVVSPFVLYHHSETTKTEGAPPRPPPPLPADGASDPEETL